ncbi:MAG: M36 family metallopeptidase [Deltaproteobacteria bacterium]|nr:M36 family metallopeptidase [Deltaproteobacteria bacterium]
MIRRMRLLVGLGCFTLALGCTPEVRTPGGLGVGVATQASPRGVATAAPRVYPSSVATALDEARGVPRFLRATTRQEAPAGATAEVAARAHLLRHAPAYRVATADLANAEVTGVHDPGHGGVIVTLRQRAHGVEVYRGELKVLMRRSLELVAITGTPLVAPPAPPAFTRPPRAALAAALGAHFGAAVAADDLTPLGPAPGGFDRLDLTRPVAVRGGTVHLSRPARVKPVLVSGPGALRPAHFVEFYATRPGGVSSAAFRYVIAADDGRVLERRNLTAEAHRYRVWADGTGRPLDGPQADFTPHPTGSPDGSDPAFIPSRLVEQEAFNHNPAGQADPWLPAGATETVGNNVDAYADLQPPDGFTSGDLRATTTAADTFNHGYDTALAPAADQTQIMAAITQAFYVVNWLHDWYYDSGFDEAAGNAQQTNFGRGGVGGDRILVEAQDYSEMNNANMSTMADGEPPKMQLLLWTGPEQRTLHVTPPDQDLDTATAAFGPRDFDLTGTVVLVNDGTAPTADACETIANDVAGKIALLDRGTCTFKQKAVNAQAAGAGGVILANNQGLRPVSMPDAAPYTAVTIPVLSVSSSDGAAIKEALQQGAVTAHLTRVGGVDRDCALDNAVVAHEWGHYLHLRLADCGQAACGAMGEGWGDFLALHLALREGDDLDGTYAASGIYVGKGTETDSAYFGGRRAAYSVDFTKNAFTFRHIADGEPLPTTTPLDDLGYPNSEVHCAGEIWAQMLFEVYVALLKETQGPGATRTFDEARRTMSDYVVAGLKVTPADATYLETRDALLAVAGAASPADQMLIAAAFARRGAGSCAESPPRDSSDFVGVVESYEVKPNVVLGEPTLDDSLASCDGNGRLDAGERGRLQVEVTNASIEPLGAATLTVAAHDPAITFPAGPSVSVGPLAPFGSTTVDVEVALDLGLAAMKIVTLDATVAATEACHASVTRAAAFRVNYEERPAATATDDVEASSTVWTPNGDGAEEAWARPELEPGNHVWHGADLAHPSDSWLESPPLPVSATGRFVVSFRHRYEFETADEDPGKVYYDGAVIEVSGDGGSTWEDVSTWADPGYGGIVTDVSGNPLADRLAYVERNAAWPDLEAVRLDLGTAFAGQTVALRFRIGTDPAAGGSGWDLDDIALQGIDGTPFALVAFRPTACTAPQADAGSDGSADGGSHLDGRNLATCGGCASGSGPAGALLAALVLAAVIAARRRRR